MQRPQDLPSQLMDFRTSYLTAVARAAIDFHFRRVLTDPCVNPLDTLRKYFGYECPWDITLVLKDDPDLGPRVNVANGTIMTQPFMGESILIYIPDIPDKPEAVAAVEALAAYYHLTSFFLPARDVTLQTALTMKYEPDSHPQPDGSSKWFSVNMLRDTSARFDLGVAVENFVSFAACMFNAVALAWNNTHFKTLLTDPCSKEPAIGLLQTWLGYKYPWFLNLQVRIDPHAEFVYGEDKTKGKWKIRAPQLTLTLPWMTGAPNAKQEIELNDADPHVAIMGLTLYNTDGAGYPFTCG